jgi:site-specific recombinase XerD
LDYRNEAPNILRDFLIYHETIKGHSRKTVDEYFLDLRNFFRYLKHSRKLVPESTELDEISIKDVGIELVRSVTLADIYDYMSYLSRERPTQPNNPSSNKGLSAASRARKIATIRSFFKYLTNKARLLEENPVKDLDSPRIKKSLPRYLDLDSSIHLLESVDGRNRERDYCILTLFLNCGLRISELVGLNLSDIRDDHLRVLGKGNKERIVYLNDACVEAIGNYTAIRGRKGAVDKNALFLTDKGTRITKAGVHWLVKKHLSEAGLDSSRYSSHKLRHTAATLMLQNGVDVRTLQEVLGHEHLNTTQIYTHVDNNDLKIAARANPLSKIKVKKESGEK